MLPDTPPVSPTNTARASSLFGDFDDFWRAYPNKRGKPGARRAWTRATRVAEPRALIEAATRYAQDPNLPEARFIPYAAKWLGDERWNDPPCPPRNASARRPNGAMVRAVDTDRASASGRLEL